MKVQEPTPLDKLPVPALAGLILEYHEAVTRLHNRMADIIVYRRTYDRDTGEDISGLSDRKKFARTDDDTEKLARVKVDAGDCLDALKEPIEEEGEDVWESHKADLGRWLEELVYYKVACENELFDLDEELEYTRNKQSADA